MKKCHFIFCLLLVHLFFFLNILPAAQYQYALLIESISKNHEGSIVILSYENNLGYPITVMGKRSEFLMDAYESAYKDFYEQMKWKDTKNYDLIYILNCLGKEGWEVINFRQMETSNFEPAIDKEYLLKKEIHGPKQSR